MKIVLLFLLLLAFRIQPMQAQQSDIIDKGTLISQFKNDNDSLFLVGQYSTMITKCKGITDTDYRKGAADVYLIAAYFFMNDTLKSDLILNKVIKNAFDENRDGKARTSCIWLVYAPTAAMHYYLNIPYCREKVFSEIVSNYELETMSHKAIGRQIVKSILFDQFIRGNSTYTFDSLKKASPNLKWEQSPAKFLPGDPESKTALYNLYQKEKRLFSQVEIGSAYWWQFLLFAHEVDLKRRAYYLKLLKNASKKGICDRDYIIDFILRTESQKLGPNEFSKIKNKLIKELKKEYNVPDYYYKIF